MDTLRLTYNTHIKSSALLLEVGTRLHLYLWIATDGMLIVTDEYKEIGPNVVPLGEYEIAALGPYNSEYNMTFTRVTT